MDHCTTADRIKRSLLFRGSRALSVKQNRILNIFFGTVLAGTFLAMLGTLLYYVYAYASRSMGILSYDWLLGIFSDFVYIMNVSLEESPYVLENSSYPPLAICMLYPFALICKDVFAQYSSEVLSVDELTAEVVLHTEFWVAIILFVAICSFLVIALLTKLFRLEPVPALKLGVITLLSAPFVFTVMRGNTIYFALILVLAFLVFSRSEHLLVREVGYLCLVLAGLIKIYPLFFGVFLLHKKKIWASVRIGIYTVVLFFLSFLLFGGSDDLLPFINNLSGFASSEVRLIEPNNLSIASVLHRIVGVFSVSATETDAFQTFTLAVMLLVFAVATVPAIMTKNEFSRYAIVTSVIILIPSISYFYVLIFAILPFVQFIRDYEVMSARKRRFYSVVFSFLFLTVAILPQNYALHSAAIIAMLITECVSVFREYRPSPKKAAITEQ